MAAEFERDTLPDQWSFGVRKDGRVFFINDETNCTTWLHPRTGEPVNSGHMIRSDLPRGWEEGFTEEGASYFINHNQRATTFRHPETGQTSSENFDFVLREQPDPCMSKPQTDQRPPSMVSELSGPDAASGAKGSRPSGKVHSFGKRDHAIKRSPNVPVVVRGWLHKQDSSGMRLWKRRWFVLSDFCLFYYKDSREEVVLGSIPLPGYAVTPVEPHDHVSRKYAFKACHTGMRSYIQSSSPVQAEHATVRTYFFSADTQEDMNGWTRAMSQAALLQSHGTKRESEGSEKSDASERQANHAEACSRSSSQPEREVRSEDGGRYAQEGRVVARPPAAAATGADVPSLDLPGPPLAPFAPHTQGNGRSPIAPRREPNGHAMYKRGLWAEPDKEAQRKNVLSQVEHWVKVQKGDPKSLPSSEHVLPWRTPPTQPRACSMETYQSLPRTSQYSPGSSSPPAPRDLPSDYKYAHDRLSHFRMSPDERVASKEGMVWRLYEWQQRRQFRHGSPTAPIGVPAAGSDPFTPRSVSVPPSPSDGPPPKALSPRRPHTPAERVTVRPLDERPATAIPGCNSPRRMQSQLFKTAPADRRSMPPVGYITHTVSAPSLHGKTLEELTLLLVQLRRHQAQMAGKRTDALAHLRWGHGPSGLSLQADDTYMKLKSDLEYLDLKVTGRDTLKDRSAEPVRIAESDIDVKLSRLCEQDKTLQELETRVRMLKEDKDKLESVLDVSHQQMEQYRDQPAHVEKIAYQQRLLQEDVVHIRAEISRVTTEMENAWSEYGRLEMDLTRLRESLQDQMNRSILSQQEKAQMRKELWRMEDVLAGLSSNKANYKVTIDSVKNPERKLGPSVPLPSVPSPSASAPGGEAMPALHLSPESRPSHLVPQAHSAHKSVPKRMEDEAPPRPPLPQLYSPDQEAPTVPPLPKEASVVRHTSVRGLKRQSDERKRDRDTVQYVNGDYKVELRSYLSEPQLSGTGSGPGGTNVAAPRSDFGSQTLPSRGLAGSTPRLNQSADISSYVTLRRGVTAPCLKVRPKSALERLCSGEPQQGGRMSAEEQLERMKRHQRALLRERKRTLSQGERPATAAHAPSSYSSSSRPLCADPGSWRREQEFDLQLLERAVRGEEHRDPLPRSRSDEWLTVHARPMSERDLEPMDFQLDLSRELSKPQKVSIPERYLDTEPGEPLSRQDVEARHRKVERIKSILTKSSVGGMQPLMAQDQANGSDVDSALQEQERIITMSYTLASEASLKSKEVAAKALSEH